MFDTLTDLGADVLQSKTCEELVKKAWRLPMMQQSSGTLMTGVAYPSTRDAEWGSGCRFGGSVIYVRSYPKGRFGMPLQPNELRVLVTCSASMKTGIKVITIVRMLLSDGLDWSETPECKRESYGALAVPFMPIYLFEDHVTDVVPGCWVPGSTGYHMVAPGSVTVHENEVHRRIVCSNHEYVVAGSLLGVRMPDRIRQPAEDVMSDEWSLQAVRMVKTLTGFVSGESSEEKMNRTKNAIVASRMLCESLSASGIVDLLASDVVQDALPDPLSRTESMPLLIAVFTRIAAYPTRYGLTAGTANDVWAAGTISAAFEVDHKPALVVEDGEGNKDVLYAIDVVANFVLSSTSSRFSKGVTDRDVEKMVHRSAMEWCLRTGYQLCVDVAAPSTYENLYTSNGFADQLVDAVTIAHDGVAISKGLGRLRENCMPPRQVNRAGRQQKLLEILDAVDEFLHSGQQNGRLVVNPNSRPVREEVLDKMGYVQVPRFARGRNGNEDPDLCTDALAAAQRLLEKVFFRGAATPPHTSTHRSPPPRVQVRSCSLRESWRCLSVEASNVCNVPTAATRSAFSRPSPSPRAIQNATDAAGGGAGRAATLRRRRRWRTVFGA